MDTPFAEADAALPDYCRLCLAENVQMVVPKEPKVFNQLAAKIKDCLHLWITVSELSSSFICKKCYETLERLHQFRLRCHRYNSYLALRRSLDPDRKHPLRYDENWYWYSCQGNNAKCVYWGCSVVCCPAYIITHPSGKVYADNAQHQHKQKIEDVRNVYCNGEYVYDGYRFSFSVMNPDRTLTFSCRSLNDPFRKCPATLTTNDKSEVLSTMEHNHSRELIIESAAKHGRTGDKQTITLIRGMQRELAICQGFWYETKGGQQDSVFHWECIRYDCSCFITMKDGVLEYYGKHDHGAVWLKWGAELSKSNESKYPMLMKIINPPTISQKQNPQQAKYNSPASSIIPASVTVIQPQASNSAIRSISSRSTFGSQQVFHTDVPNTGNTVYPTSSSATLSRNEFKIEETTLSCSNDNVETTPDAFLPCVTRIKNEPQDFPNEMQNIIPTPPTPCNAVRPPPPALQGKGNTRFKTVPKIVNIRPNHPINVVRQPLDMLPTTSCAKTLRVYQPRHKLKSTGTTSNTAVPKILHVMSLNKHSNESKANSSRHLEAAPVAKTDTAVANPIDMPEPLMLTAIKTEPGQDDGDGEAETITDEVLPPVGTVASSSNDYMRGFSPSKITEIDDDALCDLQDDGDIPPIVPVVVGSPATEKKYQTTRKINDPHGPKYRSAMLKKIVDLHKNTVPSSSNPIRSIQRNLDSSGNSDNDYSARDTKIYNRMSDPEKYARTVPLERKMAKTPPTTASKLSPVRCNKRMGNEFQIHGTTVKRLKTDIDTQDAIAPEIEHAPESAGHVEPDEPSDPMDDMNDPIAVPAEPHENVPSTGESDILQNAEATSCIENSAEANKAAEIAELIQSTDSDAKPLPVRNPKENDNSSEKTMSTKTVQVVKLQKSEQMLNFEGHLYKINWCNRRFNYWECMLREQVRCMAILETRGNDSRSWTKYGSHNHKVPKPIVNDDSEGKYQMFNASSGIAQVKRPPKQNLTIQQIKEQDGKMMSLRRRKLFNYSIMRKNSKLTLTFGNNTYYIVQMAEPGFIWKCTACSTMLETDEKFTVARESGEPHNHGLNTAVIDLANEAWAKEASGVKVGKLDQHLQPSPIDAGKQSKLDSDDDDDDSGGFPDQQEMGQVPEADEPSDDEEVVLDPLNGEFTTKGEIKRKNNRAMLEGDTNGNDEDDIILDPLTGEFRRKGDPKLLEINPPEEEQEQDPNTDGNKQTAETDEMPNEDFEELLKKESGGPSSKSKITRNSLAALKQELLIHNKLRDNDSERNFESIPQTDGTCLIRYNEFTYQLDTVQSSFSIWKCWLSPQYACRGKIHLNADCKEVNVSGVNHCHASTTKDMFVSLPERVEGDILDGDLGTNRKYTFQKRANNLYCLQLEDGFVYSCLTMSKTGVSSWRCVSRKNDNCKAIVTMEGEFHSITRNRFSHTHDPPSLLGESEDEKKTPQPKTNADSSHTKKKNLKQKDEEKRKRKRQTL